MTNFKTTYSSSESQDFPSNNVQQKCRGTEDAVWALGQKFGFRYRKHQGKDGAGILFRITMLGSHGVVIHLFMPRALLPLPRLSQLSVRNVVPDNAPIFEACRAGNVSRVSNLLQRGCASLNDVTPQNHTLLAVRPPVCGFT